MYFYIGFLIYLGYPISGYPPLGPYELSILYCLIDGWSMGNGGCGDSTSKTCGGTEKKRLSADFGSDLGGRGVSFRLFCYAFRRLLKKG